MNTVNTGPVNSPELQQNFANAARDGKISNREVKQLNQLIDSMALPEDSKASLKNMVQGLSDASTKDFKLFGFIPLGKVKDQVTPAEMQQLQQMSQSNPLAQQLLQHFAEASAPRRPQEQNQTRSDLASADFEPGGLAFNGQPGRAAGADAMCYPPGPIDRRPDWHVQQNTNLPSASGDCGPSCAAMIARSFGFMPGADSADAIQTVRETLGATSTRDGKWAISENEISTAVSRLSGGQVQNVGNQDYSSSNSGQMIEDIKASLSRGERPMILTGVPGASFRHYMVVAGVDENNNLILADPAMSDHGPGYATTRTVSQAELQQWMQAAESIGRDNTLMRFSG